MRVRLAPSAAAQRPSDSELKIYIKRPSSLSAIVWAAAKPHHPWIDLGGTGQFDRFGAWRTDRETGKAGLTLAGLLMFGKHQAILSPGAAPQYLVDSRDYRGRKPEERWGDRVFPDGTWEANLF